MPNPQTTADKYRKLIKERMPAITPEHTKDGHFYRFNGKLYPSVTGALQILKDPGLTNWKMNRALDYVSMNFPQFTMDNIGEHLEKAKLVPQLEFEGAGSIGSAVHNWREKWFSHWIETGNSDDLEVEFENVDHLLPDREAANSYISGTRAIKKFIADTGYIPVACELYVADEELEIAGTLDDIGILPCPTKYEVDDPVLGKGYKIKFSPKLVLVDLKTSNIGNKTSYFLQVALYYHMFRKLTNIEPQEFYILHVSKTDGTYKLIPIKNITQLVHDAKLLLKLNNSLARIDEEKKKEPIII